MLPTTLDPMPADAARLLHFNRQLLDQALALCAAMSLRGAPPYARPVGAHLRHLIEHYEALLFAPQPGFVDYDRRPRDGGLERCPIQADERLRALQQQLAHGAGLDLQAPLQVLGQAGLAGELAFQVISSVGRELVFLASHAVHHFALLRGFCIANGIDIAPDFGHAPATVAHARAAAAAA